MRSKLLWPGSFRLNETAVSLFGLVYQVNLQTAAVFQDAAGVAGVRGFPIEGIVLTLGFAIARQFLLVGRERS